MKKWMLSAIVYLAIVIVGYFTYEAVFIEEQSVDTHGSDHDASVDVTDKNSEDHASHSSAANDDHSENAHEHDEQANSESAVNVTVKEENKTLVLTLEDLSGNPVTDLEVNHEKRLHLIVVDEHLDQYFHLHPEETAPGQFEISSKLEEGTYKAFVDIKPKNLEYEVQPITFTVGNSDTDKHSHGSLEVDQQLEKTIGGNKVTMSTTPLVIDETVTLTFDVHGAKLEQYLGALGHVVILDEQGEEYLHVHPLEEENPVFETQFSQPGIYKIWAEFQENGKVTAYPFVVEVK
ncbi:hypothetical protein [Metabacillus bambusae]|uniref:Secreted protein n=1 Tax=Metabacillus bambusae TaxID=2795218 RepID=A0ABS3N0B2_9BACI|nr:hypothetical protein [Metabacillus bambusae]MBO1511343.1 hypothetical protein [Metabacillus bambusae]